MSDQLFWIFAVLLVVEILSQLFQFESLGKIFVQFYIIAVHGLVGITLATFETRSLVYYFVVLIAFINSLRFLLYKLPSIEDSSVKRFFLDIVVLIILFVAMWVIDPYLNFNQVPNYSSITQFSVLASLGVALFYEMLQRANDTGIHFDDFLPRSLVSFVTVVGLILFGVVLIMSYWFEITTALKYQLLFVYVLVIMVVRTFSLWWSRDPEFYDLLYFIPSLVTITLFIQLIILGG